MEWQFGRHRKFLKTALAFGVSQALMPLLGSVGCCAPKCAWWHCSFTTIGSETGATLRHIMLNILRKEPNTKRSIRHRRLKAEHLAHRGTGGVQRNPSQR
jgi:hypothetical protein